MDFLKILYPIEWVVAWIMYLAHSGLTALGLDAASGLAWGLSIVTLVVVMRILLIPLFFKQIKASRGMQIIAPEMQAIQKKYKGKTDPASREAMSRETMALYKKHGTNPFASCLPILAQSPIFFALFRVLNSLDEIGAGTRDGIGPIDQVVAAQAERSTILGAPLSSTFMQAGLEGDAALNTRLVTILLIVAMSATTFLTQRQLTMKNMPPSALQGPMAQQQKVLLYVLPLIFAFSGVNFPIGVLIYWTTTNLWSMGQQFYTIRRMPAPGSEAERRLKERRQRKGKDLPGTDAAGSGTTAVIEPPAPKGQRQQPVGKARAKAKPSAGTRPPTAGSTGPSGAGPAKPATAGGSSGPAKGASTKRGTSAPGSRVGSTGASTDAGARRKPRPTGATAVQPTRGREKSGGRAPGAPTSGSERGASSTDAGDASSTKPTT
ncbi:membrane protein insertase YidC [uncultured Cellulomonas sp.]|uniref:membrane protein insertase YidC n=1 Tax=uncultured Cellulomonas sp. TaxID=189682 RepID=UPI0026399893|nr:membrane protein insertase YidC [uncultured Cellulomonas sp.]